MTRSVDDVGWRRRCTFVDDEGARASDGRAGDAPWVERRVEWRAVIAPDIAEGDACGRVAVVLERLLGGRRRVG